MKKKLFITMLFTLIFLLAACVSTEDDTPTPTDPVDPTEEPVIPSFGYDPEWVNTPITLTFASWVNSDLENLMLDAFMEKYPNVTVEKDTELVNPNNPGWEGQLIERAAAKTLPDVFAVRFLDHVYLNDLGLNVKPFLDQDSEKDSIMAAALESATYGDKTFAIPATTTPKYMLVNTKLLEDYDVSIPAYNWSIEDYENIVDSVFNVEPGGCAFGAYSFGEMIGAYAAIMDASLGYQTFDGLNFNFTSPSYRAIIEREMTHSAKLLNYLTTDDLKVACEQEDTWWAATGQLAIFSQPLYDMGWFPGSYASRNGGTSADTHIFFDDIDLYPLPKVEGKDQVGVSGVNFMAISPTITDAKIASAAYELAKWMGFGREGTLARNAFIENWNDHTSTLFFGYWRFPVTNDPEVWATLPHATSDDFALPGLQSQAFIDSIVNGLIENNRSVPGQQEGLSAAQGLFGSYRRGEYSGSLADVLREMEETANQIIEDTMKSVGW
jgi:multiple sugar transport system substrate-binding protein